MKPLFIKFLIVAILLMALSFTETDLILENFAIDQANNTSIRFWILIAIVALYGLFASHVTINKNQERYEN